MSVPDPVAGMSIEGLKSLIEGRFSQLHSDMRDIQSAVKLLPKMETQLDSLRADLTRAWTKLDEHDKRLRDVELKEAERKGAVDDNTWLRRTVIAGMITLVVLAAAGLFTYLLDGGRPRAETHPPSVESQR